MSQNKRKKKPARTVNYSSDMFALHYVGGGLLAALGIVIFMALVLQMQGDIFAGLRSVCYGLAGMPAILLPLFPIWGGVLLFITTQRHVSTRELILALVMYILVLTSAELLTYSGSVRMPLLDYFKLNTPYSTGYGDYLVRAWSWNVNKAYGGGALGMMLAWPIWKVTGAMMGGVLCIIAVIVTFCFLIRLDAKGICARIKRSIGERQQRNASARQQHDAQKEAWDRSRAMQDEARLNEQMNPQQQQQQPGTYARPAQGWSAFSPSATMPPVNGEAVVQPPMKVRERKPVAKGRTATPYGFQPTEEELNAASAPMPETTGKKTGLSRIFGGKSTEMQAVKPHKLSIFSRHQDDEYEENEFEENRVPEEDGFDAYRRPETNAPAPREVRNTPQREWTQSQPVMREEQDRPHARSRYQEEEETQVPVRKQNAGLQGARTVQPAPSAVKTGPMPKQQPKPSWDDTPPWEETEEPAKVNKRDVQIPKVSEQTPTSWKAQLDLAVRNSGSSSFGEEREKKKKEFVSQLSAYIYPGKDLLRSPTGQTDASPEEDSMRAQRLEETLASFKVDAKVRYITHGPAITRFELELAPGINVNKVTSLGANIAMNMEVQSVRIEAPIPGKKLVGIEVPNRKVSTVTLREVLESEPMQNAKSSLVVALGKDIAGSPIVCDLARMPHLLIAGATGSGKSVCINAIINSLLYRCTPHDVKMILVDPKVVELQCYNGIPHLLIPVVSDPHKASGALAWAVGEMSDRYNKFKSKGVRAIDGYNAQLQDGEEYMPRIVIIIDELADLMMTCKRDVEDHICRLAQLARAAGIHLIVATQRPSVDVITGLIKANIPSRIAFKVTSNVDSRTILDKIGAEQLLGWGDMLYQPTGSFSPTRVQGCFLSDEEVNDITAFVRTNNPGDYDPDILEKLDQLEHADDLENPSADDFSDSVSGDGTLLEQAIEMTVRDGQVSTSLLQRRLKVGYARAGRLVDEMERRGIVSQKDGAKPRMCLITQAEYEQMREEGQLED